MLFELSWLIVVMILAAVIVATGVVLLGLALYHYLAAAFSMGLALTIVGILALVTGGIALWLLHRTLN